MTGEPDFRDFYYSSKDGLRLHARIYSASVPGRWPVVCLPGLTRNARDFHRLALYLSQKPPTPRQVIAFDYRGRGQSQYDDDAGNYTVAAEAGDVLTGLGALGIAEAAFIGTSRGGLIVHLLGTMQPALLKAAVLNDIGPEIEAAGLAHIRSYLGAHAGPTMFEQALEAQRAIHGADFPALRPEDWEAMAAALYREEGGTFVPDFDPKLRATLADLDLTGPLPTLWPQFEALTAIPVLAIRGENSRPLSAATLAQMRRRHPSLEALVVPGQEHPPLLETGTLPEQIVSFLDRAATARRSPQDSGRP